MAFFVCINLLVCWKGINGSRREKKKGQIYEYTFWLLSFQKENWHFVLCAIPIVCVYSKRWLCCGYGNDITVAWFASFQYPSHNMCHALWRLMNHIWIMKWVIFHCYLIPSPSLHHEYINSQLFPCIVVIFVIIVNIIIFCMRSFGSNHLRFFESIVRLCVVDIYCVYIHVVLLLFVLHIWHGAKATIVQFAQWQIWFKFMPATSTYRTISENIFKST